MKKKNSEKGRHVSNEPRKPMQRLLKRYSVDLLLLKMIICSNKVKLELVSVELDLLQIYLRYQIHEYFI